jgi:hypothetical protein
MREKRKRDEERRERIRKRREKERRDKGEERRERIPLKKIISKKSFASVFSVPIKFLVVNIYQSTSKMQTKVLYLKNY